MGNTTVRARVGDFEQSVMRGTEVRELNATIARLTAEVEAARGWQSVETAPTKHRVLVCGGDTPNGVAIAICDPGRYTPWHESHGELEMVRSWYAEAGSSRSIWPHPTGWMPLPTIAESTKVAMPSVDQETGSVTGRQS